MSLDFQSIQSIDNLANLIQTGAAPSGNVPQAGMKNADFGNLGGGNSAGDLNMAAQRLASSARMGSFLQSLSNSNIGASASASNLNSSANLSNLMKTMQQQQQQSGNASLANLLRPDSSTGLSALRMQEGINNRNTSVDDFLSLMAAGDIPHQDPALLNVPLMDQQQGGSQMSQQQRQLLANALSSRSLNGMVGSGGSNAALFNAFANGGDSQSQSNLNAMLAMAMGNNAAAAAAAAASAPSTSGTKRSLDQAGGGDLPSAKR
jgi:hypothetical protein